MQLELNGTNVISESERGGEARSLFWPWCGANVSLLALSYGAFFLGFKISFIQATIAAVLGTVLSFGLVGVSSLAGKKSNAPTMVLSRASFGVRGNIVPGFLSYLIFVGWETVLVSLATLATGTVFVRVGHLDRNIALVGRVIEGIEHLSSLPRGTGALGFYETAAERVPIVSVRLGGEVSGLPAYEYLSTESDSFARYADARANRRDAFFIRPAGGADICNIPVPVRRVK